MATKTRIRLDAFTDKLSCGQHKPQRRFIHDALFGLHQSGDVMLSSWGRSLREPRRLIHTEKRLSIALKSERLKFGLLRSETLSLMAGLVNKHCSAISIDTTDLRKTYGRKMPWLGRVHDGSKGELGTGWMVLRADGVAEDGRHIPLDIVLYSHQDPAYNGEHSQLRDFIKTILGHVRATTPFVFDAGFDGRSYRTLFDELGLHFTARLVLAKRSRLRRIIGSTAGTLGELVDETPATFRFRVRRFRKKAKRSWRVSVGWHSNIQFFGRRNVLEQRKYSVVVVRYENKDSPPMALLTTDRVRTEAQAKAVVDRYFSRWAVEDGHRLLKTHFSLENVRVLTWTGLQRLVFLAHAAYAFMAWLVYMFDGERLAAMASAFGPVPKFLYYRLGQVLAGLFAS